VAFPDEDASKKPEVGGRPALTVSAYAETHVGAVRKINEDSILDLGEIGLWVVADGVGGADAGDFASQLVVSSLSAVSGPSDAQNFQQEVLTVLEAVNRRLREEAASNGTDRIIASTVVCLLFFDGHYCCIWAGDSRIYRLRGDRFEQMTHDHSEVQSLLDFGLITVEEARQYPNANVITRAVGAEDSLSLDVTHGTIEPGDAFLLCSDGLTKVAEDWEIGAVLGSLPAEEAVRRLIHTTLERGGPDNVSVVAVKIGGIAVPSTSSSLGQ
jgi:serine/threonine protein phosphatase PrpC